MTKRQKLSSQRAMIKDDGRGLKSHGSLDADIIIANAPDPVFVSDLEGKIVQANDAVSQLLGLQKATFWDPVSFHASAMPKSGAPAVTAALAF